MSISNKKTDSTKSLTTSSSTQKSNIENNIIPSIFDKSVNLKSIVASSGLIRQTHPHFTHKVSQRINVKSRSTIKRGLTGKDYNSISKSSTRKNLKLSKCISLLNTELKANVGLEYFNNKEKTKISNELVQKYPHLKDGWIFTNNKPEFQITPDYLYHDGKENKKWLVRYERYNNRDWPIIFLPKGTMLYTYSRSDYIRYINEHFEKNNIEDNLTLEKLLFNLYNNVNFNETDINRSLKYFYPVPHASLNVGDYDTANIVYLHKDIKLLALCLPSPVTHNGLMYNKDTLNRFEYPNVIHSAELDKLQNNETSEPSTFIGNYYNNIDTYARYYDLELSTDLMKTMDVQGYIGISKIDSISHSPGWFKLKNNEKYKNIFKQFVYKSCIDARFTYTKRELPGRTPPGGNILETELVYGIPEIVLSPFCSSLFDNKEITIDKLKMEYENNNIEQYFNYTKMHICKEDEILNYLNSIADNIKENPQSPLFHVYDKYVDKEFSRYLRPITHYSDLTLNDIDFEKNYKGERGVCAFACILYYLMKAGYRDIEHNPFIDLAIKEHTGTKEKTWFNYLFGFLGFGGGGEGRTKSHEENIKTTSIKDAMHKKPIMEMTKNNIVIVRWK